MASAANNNPKPSLDEKLLVYAQTVVELQARTRMGAAITDPAYLAKLEEARNNIATLLNVLQTPNR